MKFLHFIYGQTLLFDEDRFDYFANIKHENFSFSKVQGTRNIFY